MRRLSSMLALALVGMGQSGLGGNVVTLTNPRRDLPVFLPSYLWSDGKYHPELAIRHRSRQRERRRDARRRGHR